MIKRQVTRILRGLRRYNPLTGQSLVSHINPEDIIIAGYPKSGNTWSQVLISGLVYGASPFFTPDSVVQDLVPDVHNRRFYRRYQTPMFFKSHHLPRPDYRRVIYLLRDGRDVMVSYLHYLHTTGNRHLSFTDMVEAGAGLFPCRWHEHVRAWQNNPYSAEIITVKYEDLLDDPVRELERICAFAHIDRPRELIERVARESQFEKMQEREQRLGWADPHWPKDVPFVRKGKAGGWQDEFPPDCLAAFMKQAGETLRQCGYV